MKRDTRGMLMVGREIRNPRRVCVCVCGNEIFDRLLELTSDENIFAIRSTDLDIPGNNSFNLRDSTPLRVSFVLRKSARRVIGRGKGRTKLE